MSVTKTRSEEEAVLSPWADGPCGFDAGDANLRRVVGNDPTNATDPTGLFDVPTALGKLKASNPVAYGFITSHHINVESIGNFWNDHPAVSGQGSVISIDDRESDDEAAGLIPKGIVQIDAQGWSAYVAAYYKEHPQQLPDTRPVMRAYTAEDMARDENQRLARAWAEFRVQMWGPDGVAYQFICAGGSPGSAGFETDPSMSPGSRVPELREQLTGDRNGPSRPIPRPTLPENVEPTWARQIARGHAFDEHGVQFARWGIDTTAEFEAHLRQVVGGPVAVRQLARGRTAFWAELPAHEGVPGRICGEGTIIIRDPNNVDGGTAFRGTRDQFDNLPDN